MNSKKGPIIIAEDDIDDRDVLRDIFSELGVKNELKFFDNGQQVLDYLLKTTDSPFLIFSDVNLPMMSGTRLRQLINENDSLRRKSIPFVFLTTNTEKEYVSRAFDQMVQGYFQKDDNINQIRNVIRTVIDYWTLCHHPNTQAD